MNKQRRHHEEVRRRLWINRLLLIMVILLNESENYSYYFVDSFPHSDEQRRQLPRGTAFNRRLSLTNLIGAQMGDNQQKQIMELIQWLYRKAEQTEDLDVSEEEQEEEEPKRKSAKKKAK